jgi:C-terminal processing protease CtpA/Prc
VTEVIPGSPVDRAGVKVGDVITDVGDKRAVVKNGDYCNKENVDIEQIRGRIPKIMGIKTPRR